MIGNMATVTFSSDLHPCLLTNLPFVCLIMLDYTPLTTTFADNHFLFKSSTSHLDE